jgi:hypothetical protein
MRNYPEPNNENSKNQRPKDSPHAHLDFSLKAY